MKTYIGIDTRKRQHYAVALTEQGEKTFIFTHRRIGFENFSKWISEVGPIPREFAINSNEPFSSAVAAWLRANGETVQILNHPSTAQYLAESLKNGLHFEPQQNRQSIKDLLDLAIFYLRISVASMV